MLATLGCIAVCLAPVCYTSWLTSARANLAGAASDIMERQTMDEACDLSADLMADLELNVRFFRRVNSCWTALWGLVAGYTIRELL
jgi:hypothetical protein